MKALDNIYRGKYQEYHCSDIVYNSKETNWRDVPWDKVTKIVTYIKGKEYKCTLENYNNAKFFMCFRWGGFHSIKTAKGLCKKEINLWTVGICDGIMCLLFDYDFHTGDLVDFYIKPVKDFIIHVHPKVTSLLKV